MATMCFTLHVTQTDAVTTVFSWTIVAENSSSAAKHRSNTSSALQTQIRKIIAISDDNVNVL